MGAYLLLMDGVFPVEDGHLLKNTQVLQTKLCQWTPSNKKVCKITAMLELQT